MLRRANRDQPPDQRLASAGGEVGARPTSPFVEAVSRTGVGRQTSWDPYVHDPKKDSLGICCSGGGIRSGSYALGALQVLRGANLLKEADYLACVSGGGYTSIAHTILVSETIKRADIQDELPKGAPESFTCLPPWAPISPEEQHLRDHSNYLAPGSGGKVWGVLNLLYGLLRHLIQFAVYIALVAMFYGWWLHWWLGPTIHTWSLGPTLHKRPTEKVSFMVPIIIVVVLGLGIGGLLLRRTSVQNSAAPSGRVLEGLRSRITTLLEVQAIVAVLAIGIPWLLLYVVRHKVGLAVPVQGFSTARLGSLAAVEGLLAGVGSLATFLVRRGILHRTLSLVMPLIGPLILIVPFLAIAYWVMIRGFVGHPLWRSPIGVAVLCAVLAVIYLFLDEVTPTMHLFYRERLATAFVGYRARMTVGPDQPGPAGYQKGEPARNRRQYTWRQPPWSEPVLFSEIETKTEDGAELPNLVVCAAVNVGKDTPPGRMAGSFTFEREYSGGPLTGYVRTCDLEAATGVTDLTLPALMAISGAAVSPSMGKMTKSWARLLLALFNVRLAVWIRNPLKGHPLSPRQMGQGRAVYAPESCGSKTDPGWLLPVTGNRLWRRIRRPGVLYAFREAFGLNDLSREQVYVSDGGHWDNLGLVELLRRGCGQILCFDASGGGVEHFNTLGEAIALARTDLGVWIDIDLTPLEVDKETLISKSDVAVGTIRYPGRSWEGVLIYAKATISKDAPQDAVAFRDRDKKFPQHSTADQLFDDQKFESYRSLGAHAAMTAIRRLVALRPHRERRR